jgi:hypothetical protein
MSVRQHQKKKDRKQNKLHGLSREVQFPTNDQWHVGQEISLVVFQESFVIPPRMLVWKYMGSK